jgi:hypothetical protein
MPAQAEQLFEEEQSFRQPWLWGLLLGTLLVLGAAFVLVVVQAPDQAGLLQALAGLGVGLLVVLGVAALMYMLRLSVWLDREHLHVRFWPLVRKDIPLQDIVRWEARTYRPILEYGGWGVRFSWKGMAYNVSGNRGVQLELANGRRILIGSQRAEELAMAISQARQHGPG